MKELTAVEWLIQQAKNKGDLSKADVKQAREKEKQHIIKAYCKAEDMSEFFEYEHRYGREYLTAETYYNETYGTHD